MILDAVADKSVLFAGGKGGVGKTTISSALALGLAERGQNVLLVSTDPAHSLGHLWQRTIGDSVTELYSSAGADNSGAVHGLEIDPQATATAHFATVQATVSEMMPEHLRGQVASYFKAATATPGAHEAAMLERIADIVVTNKNYDTILFDTAPTGHTVRLLELPELMGVWSQGMLARQRKSENFHAALNALPGGDDAPTDKIAQRNAKIRAKLQARQELLGSLQKVLTDKRRAGFIVVTLPERLPVAETRELISELKSVKMHVAAAVINRKIPDDAGGVFARRAQAEDEYVQQLRDSLGRIDVSVLPLQAEDVSGLDGLRIILDELVS